VPFVKALRRVRHTRPQVDLPASLRSENVQGAFAVRRGWCDSERRSRVDGAVVVLVDDVMTTGATLEACAQVLRRAGVGEVRALTVARAVWRLPPLHQPIRPRGSATRRS
jgi:predicted amidophosphoribosyltransferase